MKKNSATFYQEYHAGSEPLTVTETIGPIENKQVTIAPGGSMTTVVLGADATPEDVNRAIDALLKRKHEKKSDLQMYHMSGKASKEAQMAMARKARLAFQNPSSSIQGTEAPVIRNEHNTAGSHISIVVGADAPEDVQVAIARALFR